MPDRRCAEDVALGLHVAHGAKLQRVDEIVEVDPDALVADADDDDAGGPRIADGHPVEVFGGACRMRAEQERRGNGRCRERPAFMVIYEFFLASGIQFLARLQVHRHW